MEFRRLGTSGLRVSALSFGSWVTFGEQVGEDRCTEMMKVAYDAGVNFFDNAEGYARGGAETIMGNVIRKQGWRRSDLVLSTKIFWGKGDGPNDSGLSRKHILEGTDASLERLGTDYVDLIFCHRPDQHTPIEETVRAMHHVVTQGKALYWGTSEWSAEQIRLAHEFARREHLIPPTMEQPQYNMFARDRVEKEYQSLYRDIGLGTTIWSPLASGMLTGKYNDGIPQDSRLAMESYDWLKRRCFGDQPEQRVEKIRRLGTIAAELSCTLPQMAIAWCLRQCCVSTVITGASRPEQVEENMRALAFVDRVRDAEPAIEAVLDNAPAPDTDWRGLT